MYRRNHVHAILLLTVESMRHTFTFTTKVWLYPGLVGWHFITLPKELAEEIKTSFAPLKKGWGSIRVEITVGKTVWKTSIFPDKKSGSYILPLKAAIRKKEGIKDGDHLHPALRIIL